MSAHFPVLIVVFPLFAALFIGILGWFSPRIILPTALIGLLGSFASSIGVLKQVLAFGTVHYHLGNWAAPYGIEFVADPLNAVILILVGFVSFFAALYAYRSLNQEHSDKVFPFYILFLLLVTGLQGITITGDAFNLYVMLEIAALTSYALLGMGKGRSYVSTFNYLIIGTMGACFYLLGVGYLFIKTGTLNMAHIADLIGGLFDSRAILIAFIFMMVGLWIKMGFFPFHGWLPNVYTFAPIASACLIAPLMTKVSVYVMIRVMYYIFSAEYVFNILNWQPVVMATAVIAIIVGSFFALLQRDLKKLLTYLIVSEIGYMVGGAWLGNALGLTGALYHLLADALMTACLFMSIGCIIYRTKSSHFDALEGLFKRMPFTMTGFLIGAGSMIGIPPLCGFFSKWYLILGAIEANYWPFVVALLISSLINAILFFRLIEIAFFKGNQEKQAIEEAPLSMLLPVLVMSLSLIMLGLFTNDVVTLFLSRVANPLFAVL